MKKYLLFAVILLAAYFRFNNLNWDSGFHLHPDERFLTMVGGAMRLPRSFTEYLDPQLSPFNPANIGFRFFVYGGFPVIINKILAFIFENNNYDTFVLQGRFLSAFADLLVVVLIYKSVKLLFKSRSTASVERMALWSAFFYAIAVLPIQLAHYFTVDSFLNSFMFISFYFMLRYGQSDGRWTDFVLSALFFGFAISSKITALFILPLVLFLLFIGSKRKFLHSLLLTTYYLLLAYMFVRVSNPYYFESANVFDFRLSNGFTASLNTLKSLEGSNVWYPPGVQWIGKLPIMYSLVNLAVFGVGIPYFLLGLLGLLGRFGRKKTFIVLWVGGFFLYQSTQFVKNMRYFIFIYPFLSIFAGLGMLGVLGRLGRLGRVKTLYVLFVGLVLVWPFMFSSIYLRKNSRVTASEWIYRNLPSGSMILGEYWDDPLPLPVEKTYGKNFHVELLPVFDQDTQEKWKKMNTLLEKADYYILSSNRGWGSIPAVPEKYPLMSKFYKDLLSSSCHPERSEGSHCYKKIAEFMSYPGFKLHVSRYTFSVEFPDDWADESFTVYDHPKVMIFKRRK